jgi:hypothetical protein
MKKSITFLIFMVSLLYSVTIVAQQGINYKALIKDANNAVVANTPVTVKFSIIQEIILQISVYQETHTPTTDANGIIIINIGEGAVNSGVFADIDWANETLYLKTEIDIGAGLTDMGTTAFNAVPYALSAKTAENVSGLETISEGNGPGLVKVGRVATYYGAIGRAAVDLSESNSASTTRGATGDRSTAMGFNTTAESYTQTSLGSYNIPTIPESTFYHRSLDRLLVVGNGSSVGLESDALVILKNGTITAPSFDIGEITDAKALVTKEYADANYIDARFSGDYNDLTNTPFNFNATSNTGIESASNTASGFGATAFGDGTIASGANSTAMGYQTTASGNYSKAMGMETTASGYISTAMGRQTTAESYGQTSLGIYNLPLLPGSTFDFASSDQLLVVGNGASNATRSNALTILKNGTITAPSFDIAEITDDKALVTKEYADANYIDAGFSGDYNDLTNQPTIVTPTGLETINEGNGNGLVKAGRVEANYGNVGENAVDLSYSNTANTTTGATGLRSTAMGYQTTASGSASTAMGAHSKALGSISTAMGPGATAAGYQSTAMGANTLASGSWSTAMGFNTIASGRNSTAMGYVTTAESYGQTSLGRYNIPIAPISTTSFFPEDRLLVVGNGASNATRSNGLPNYCISRCINSNRNFHYRIRSVFYSNWK